MISLIQSGEYDGVSASGNTSVRLMATGDVAPINPELVPNYADMQEGIKDQDYNSPRRRAVRRAPRARAELPHVPDRRRHAGTGQLVGHLGGRPARQYKGKISIYDDSIFIADAALYLKATQPDLGIDNPYQLNDEQFTRRSTCSRSRRRTSASTGRATTRSRSSRSPTATAWSARRGHYQYVQLTGAEPPVAGRGRSSRRRARRAGRTRG